MRSLCRRYIFFYEGQDFVMKQRIRCCLWKRTNRSHLQNSMPLASFEYSLKNVSCFSTPIVDCVFVVKKNPEPKLTFTRGNRFLQSERSLNINLEENGSFWPIACRSMGKFRNKVRGGKPQRREKVENCRVRCVTRN
eukprot:UN21826